MLGFVLGPSVFGNSHIGPNDSQHHSGMFTVYHTTAILGNKFSFELGLRYVILYSYGIWDPNVGSYYRTTRQLPATSRRGVSYDSRELR